MINIVYPVLVTLFRYAIILIFAFYTLSCFTVFARPRDKRKRVYTRQLVCIYSIHFMTSLLLFLSTWDPACIVLYVVQLIFFIFLDFAYRFVYRNLSRVVLNNTIMLLMIGLVMQERLNTEYCVKQMIFAVATGIACLFVPFIIDKFIFLNKLGYVYAAAGIALLSLVFIIGKEHYGSRNWIIIGKFQMQPSEFVKIIYVFFLAACLEHADSIKKLFTVSVIAAVHVLILVAEKDLGSALIFFMTYLVLVFVATGRYIYFFGGLGLAAVASCAAYELFGHVRTRVTAWRDPWSHIENEGYQVTQSLFAIGTGGWFGMGFTQGLPGSIPVVESDFIFSAIAEEFGVFFAICLILVEISCFIMFINISLRINRRFYKLTALGLGVEYIFQTFLTVGGAVKFIPSTGVTLPLVSYGGSSCVSTLILIGIIQGMYILDKESEKSGT